MTNVQSEGEIDTWNEITLDKLKSNLSDVGLPSDSEFIRVSYVMNCCKSYDEVFEYAKKVNFSNELFTDDEGDLIISLDILFTIHKNYAKINVCF